MSARLVVVLSVVILLCSGCVGHYLYESHGTISMTPDGQSDAALYWYADEGRLWYGRRYKESDSDIDLIVCNVPPKTFVPAGHGQTELQLLSRSGDRQIAALENGDVVLLPSPVPVGIERKCGRLLVAGDDVITSGLLPGMEPEVIILCTNMLNPDRYPEARRYDFQPVIKTKVEGRPEPELTCPEE